MQRRDKASNARVLIGVPAYRGAAHVAETLRSIQAQDFGAFDALISVDGGDCETAQACEAFLSDPRFRLVVQDQRLNWHGNINWLMAQPGYEFFCYWPQDDLATRDYLASLIRFADAHPDYVCAFSDIQWFGQEDARSIFPSLTGFALTRALYVLESTNGVPLRGLIRSEAFAWTGSIRHTAFESAHEEYIWLAKLAREGKFGRVEGPLYYKRKHGGSTSPKWELREPAWKRAVWIEFGIGMLEVLLPMIAASERETALALVLERLCCPRESRFRFYDPASEPAAFATDFLREARGRCDIAAPTAAQDDGIIREALGPWLAAEALPPPGVALAKLTDDLVAHRVLKLKFQAGDIATRLLGEGWSTPEPWGTWNAAMASKLRLPIPEHGGPWEVTFLCHAYAAQHPQMVIVGIDDIDHVAEWRFDTTDGSYRRLRLPPRAGAAIVRFRFPDAISPQALGRSTDPRPLALALVMATISPARS